MFYVITVVNPIGKVINTESGKNYWVTEEEFINLDKKYYGCQIEIFNRGFCVGWPNSRGLPITPNRSESIEDE